MQQRFFWTGVPDVAGCLEVAGEVGLVLAVDVVRAESAGDREPSGASAPRASSSRHWAEPFRSVMQARGAPACSGASWLFSRPGGVSGGAARRSCQGGGSDSARCQGSANRGEVDGCELVTRPEVAPRGPPLRDAKFAMVGWVGWVA
jgi:hypothetical protein